MREIISQACTLNPKQVEKFDSACLREEIVEVVTRCEKDHKPSRLRKSIPLEFVVVRCIVLLVLVQVVRRGRGVNHVITIHDEQGGRLSNRRR